LPAGFAVQFVDPLSRDILERRLVRPAPLHAAIGAKAAVA
jgi:hypothetical protein